jgi:hypothetical protein
MIRFTNIYQIVIIAPAVSSFAELRHVTL